jgi:hypothetical protein
MKEVNNYTEAHIIEWKNKFGKVYKTIIAGEDYIWRKIKRSEYTAIMASEQETAGTEAVYGRQNEIARLAVLHPADIEQRIADNAGLATVISDECLLKSGFEVTAETQEL